MKTLKTNYKSNFLPHIQPIGACFFVTFRLHDSLPRNYLDQFRDEKNETIHYLNRHKPENYKELIAVEEKKFFKIFDESLDKVLNGVDYLKREDVAKTVVEQLKKYDGECYELLAYCIMPNHVHILIDTRLQLSKLEFEDEITIENYTPLYKIMQRIKGASARFSNLSLRRTNHTFWQRDYFDYFIRNEKELQRVISYILENPVKAKLVKVWDEWPFSFVKTYSDC